VRRPRSGRMREEPGMISPHPNEPRRYGLTWACDFSHAKMPGAQPLPPIRYSAWQEEHVRCCRYRSVIVIFDASFISTCSLVTHASNRGIHKSFVSANVHSAPPV
jgi:hypothetical protein